MHQPVLLREVIDFLQVKDKKVYFDGTIGLGGHIEAILRGAPETQVVGMDRDAEALKQVRKRLHAFMDKRLYLFHGDFKNISHVKQDFPFKIFDGALLDLGASSFQIDEACRGFSFQKEGPLDMRMDRISGEKNQRTAFDLVNTLSQQQLADIFFKYGEERFSKKIARAIVGRRKQKPFRTTLELSNLISSLSPLWMKTKIHPATRVFQALRIVINEELEGLEEAFEAILESLRVGGRLAVISFHSLEDRKVKSSFYRFENPCVCPTDLPVCSCQRRAIGRRVTKKPVIPSDREILMNPRSRSAKLRVVERL